MTQVIKVSIARTADGKDFSLPAYASRYHMGLALKAALPMAIRLNSGDRISVPVGFAIGIPDGYCGMVVSYPELADKHGVIVLDAPRLISPADRAPLFILLQNISAQQVVLRRGDIVAQLVIQPVLQVMWQDLSNAKIDSEKPTEPVLMEGAVEEEAGKEKMVSSKRTYKPPRHRFQQEEEEDV